VNKWQKTFLNALRSGGEPSGATATTGTGHMVA
jgi:hypothetical protein